MRREHNDRAWLAWHIAALDRVKKMPKLKDMLHGAPTRRKQTVEEQISIAMQWTAATARR